MIVVRLLAAFLIGILIAGQAQAQTARERDDDGLLLSLSAGHFDTIQAEDQAGEFRLEYRYDNDWFLKLWGGLTTTTDASAYVHFGIYSEFYLTDNFYIAPAFAPGIYFKGQGKDLGYPLEFRSQLDLGWRFDNGWRVSVNLNHLSNAGIGNSNPGSESIAVSLAFPLYGFWD